MTSLPPPPAGWRRVLDAYHKCLRAVVKALAWVSGAALMLMVLITTVDVIKREISTPLKGARDLVMIAAALSVAAALPYTTAIKGHVAVEFFFHKLGRRGRIAADALMRIGGMLVFGVLAWGCVEYGNRLGETGTVSMTEKIPFFWVPYVLAFSCVLVVLVKIYHLTHPGKPMLKP